VIARTFGISPNRSWHDVRLYRGLAVLVCPDTVIATEEMFFPRLGGHGSRLHREHQREQRSGNAHHNHLPLLLPKEITAAPGLNSRTSPETHSKEVPHPTHVSLSSAAGPPIRLKGLHQASNS